MNKTYITEIRKELDRYFYDKYVTMSWVAGAWMQIHIEMPSYHYKHSGYGDKINDLVQERCNSIANALELHQWVSARKT